VHHEGGQLFQSMERLDGLDLRRLLARLVRSKQRMPLPFAVRIARDVARALAYAHARESAPGQPMNIVHRDVSPHNIMLTTTGQVKLLDFGIARAAERLVRTRTGVVKGKLSYMAPEQALGVGVTPQTDIFAAGIVLWEMLAMRRLFVGENDPATVDLVVRAAVPPIAEFNPEVPVEVRALLERMLKQRAAMRPADMNEVDRVLTEALAQRFEGATDAALSAWLEPYRAEPIEMPADVGDQTEPTAVLLKEAPPTTVDEPTSSSSDVTLKQPLLGTENIVPETVEPDDGATDPVRLPTRSEIVRAVERQQTVEVPSPQGVEVDAGPTVDAGLTVDAGPTVDVDLSQSAPHVVVQTLPGSQKKDPTAEMAPVSVADDDAPTDDPPFIEAPAIAHAPMTTTDWGRHTLPGRPEQSEPSGRLLPFVTLILAALVVVLAALLILKS
ncbi:MAG: serine/threonine-protein kinase, partial [Myxococcota bacterium]